MAGLKDRTGRIERMVKRMEEAHRHMDEKIEKTMAELVKIRVDSTQAQASASGASSGGSMPRANGPPYAGRTSQANEVALHKILLRLPDYV